jgi:hypothetical protein
MDADRLYLSPSAAEKAANKAIIEHKADSFRVTPSRKRNDDRSWDFGCRCAHAQRSPRGVRMINPREFIRLTVFLIASSPLFLALMHTLLK